MLETKLFQLSTCIICKYYLRCAQPPRLRSPEILKFQSAPVTYIALSLIIEQRTTTSTLHHQRSSHTLRLLWVGALHFFINLLLAIAALCTIAYFFYTSNLVGVYVGVGLIGVWIISAFIFMARGSKIRCSLCMNPVLGGSKCQKHKNVKPSLGVSYRLGVASGVVFRGRYRCPYCGEPFSARKARGRGRSAR